MGLTKRIRRFFLMPSNLNKKGLEFTIRWETRLPHGNLCLMGGAEHLVKSTGRLELASYLGRIMQQVKKKRTKEFKRKKNESSFIRAPHNAHRNKHWQCGFPRLLESFWKWYFKRRRRSLFLFFSSHYSYSIVILFIPWAFCRLWIFYNYSSGRVSWLY